MILKCLNCREKIVENIKYKKLIRVSSDSKFFKPDGKIACCIKCGLIQKVINKKYLSEIKKIYKNYEMYKITKGDDQRLSGGLETRARRITKIIKKNLNLKKNGYLIDIGCGTGGFLKEFGNEFKAWQLYGYDINKKNHKHLKKIKNFIKLYTQKPNNTFNLISIIHTFEHVTDHFSFFNFIKSISNKNSKIFIQIPNFKNSTYDILIADHVTHFDKRTILSTLKKFLNIEYYSEEIDKEISIVGTIKNNFENKKKIISSYYIKSKSKLNERIQYFFNLKKLLSNTKNKIYVYGTTIASSWITGNFRSKIKGYIEDDLRKINKTFYGKKIVNLKHLNEKKDHIFLPFNTEVIKKILLKNKKAKYKFLYLNDKKYN